MTVRLAEALPLTGGLLLDLLELEGATLPRGPSKGRRGGGPGRMAVKSRLAEIKRATKRRRKR